MRLSLAGLLLGAACQAFAAPSIQSVEIPPKVEVRGSARLNKTRLIVLEEGRPEKWEAEVEDGKVVKKIKRLSKGRPWRLMRGRSDKDDAMWIPRVSRAYRSLTLTATGYDPGPESNGVDNVGITVSGERARFGVVAVDPKVIPLKTLLYVEGYGPAKALDIGGAIKNQRIDLCFNSTREADDYGIRPARVWLLQGLKKSRAGEVLGLYKQATGQELPSYPPATPSP